MKSTKGAVLSYKPGPVPADLPASARQYLDDELNRIAAILAELTWVIGKSNTLMLAPMSAPPPSPVTPQVVYADGVNWDPGSGAGYYYFNSNGVWSPLG